MIRVYNAGGLILWKQVLVYTTYPKPATSQEGAMRRRQKCSTLPKTKPIHDTGFERAVKKEKALALACSTAAHKC